MTDITLHYAKRGLGLLPQESIDRVATLRDGDSIDEMGLFALRVAIEAGRLTGTYAIHVEDEAGLPHTIRIDQDGEFMDFWPLPDYRCQLLTGEIND